MDFCKFHFKKADDYDFLQIFKNQLQKSVLGIFFITLSLHHFLERKSFINLFIFLAIQGKNHFPNSWLS
jgi:hypothetical protein